MRKSSSQPNLATRAVSDQDALERYAQNQLLSKRRESEARSNSRAQELESELRRRRSSVPSFATARPLASSEVDSLLQAEARARREARLLQVRDKERVNAVLRRQEYDQVRRAAAQQVAVALDRDVRVAARRRRDSFGRSSSPQGLTAYLPTTSMHESKADDDYELEEKMSSAFNEYRYSRSTPTKRPNAIKPVSRPVAADQIYSAREPVHEDMAPVASRLSKPRSESAYHLPERPVPKQLMVRKVSDEDFLLPDPRIEAERRSLWRLYDDFGEYEKRWSSARHQADSRPQDHVDLRAQPRMPPSPRFNRYQPASVNTRRFPDEWVHDRTEAREEEKQESPRYPNVQKPMVSMEHERDVVDLGPNDQIILRDDGFYTEPTMRDRRLADTTWFAMAEENLYSEDVRESDQQQISGEPEGFSTRRRGSRLSLDAPDSVDTPKSTSSRREASMAASRRAKEPPPEKQALINRLQRGERVPVPRREMLARTERTVSRLPEFTEQRKELLKREDAERRRRAVMELDHRRRSTVLRASPRHSALPFFDDR